MPVPGIDVVVHGDRSTLVDVAPYVVAVVGILSGVWTARSAGRAAHLAWLRDARLKAYEDFLTDAHEWVSKAQKLWTPRDGEPPLDVLLRDADEAGKAAFRTEKSVQALGPVDLSDAASKAKIAIDQMARTIAKSPHVVNRSRAPSPIDDLFPDVESSSAVMYEAAARAFGEPPRPWPRLAGWLIRKARHLGTSSG